MRKEEQCAADFENLHGGIEVSLVRRKEKAYGQN